MEMCVSSAKPQGPVGGERSGRSPNPLSKLSAPPNAPPARGLACAVYHLRVQFMSWGSGDFNYRGGVSCLSVGVSWASFLWGVCFSSWWWVLLPFVGCVASLCRGCCRCWVCFGLASPARVSFAPGRGGFWVFLGCFFFAVGAAFFGVGAAFFGVGRCWGCLGFSYLCFVAGSCSFGPCPFPSAAAVVRVFGWSRVFGWFALAVLRVPVSPGLSRSDRVAAACPRFASWLCGHLGCSWFVGWSVACACAASLGVSVGSGGVPAPGVQLSLFS